MKITKAFVTSDGKAFQDARDAQEHEIVELLKDTPMVDEDLPRFVAAVASIIVNNKDKVVDWLTTSANSRPAARKTNGGTKKRAKAAEQIAA